jgi:BirA family biotin operon repressor/biotin-[acetyl-CoA-carboxylase] ligase
MLRLVQLESCGSTNDEAWKLMPETALVTTRRQTKGRGRQGRSWQDGSGNIMASLALAPPRSLGAQLSWVPLAAGVACLEAILPAAGTSALSGLRLKWPNDIMWGEAKMGGILCETRFAGEGLAGLVVGLGLNVAAAPSVDGAVTDCLSAHVKGLGESERTEAFRGRFLGLWAERALYWIEELASGRATALRAAWLEWARLSEFPSLQARERDGRLAWFTALDLDGSGRLVARSETGAVVSLDQPR